MLRYYIPEKFKIGYGSVPKLKDDTTKTSSISIPSCKFKGKSWTNSHIFSRICGFAPTKSIDASLEIKKMITGSVHEFENVPQKGFRILESTARDFYNANSNSTGDHLIMLDPRGFNVQVASSNIIQMLVDGEITLSKGGIVNEELVYSWQEAFDMSHSASKSYFSLIPTTGSIYTNPECVIFETDMRNKMKNLQILDYETLEPGVVYENGNMCAPERFIYLGKSDFNIGAVSAFFSSRTLYNLRYNKIERLYRDIDERYIDSDDIEEDVVSMKSQNISGDKEHHIFVRIGSYGSNTVFVPSRFYFYSNGQSVDVVSGLHTEKDVRKIYAKSSNQDVSGERGREKKYTAKSCLDMFNELHRTLGEARELAIDLLESLHRYSIGDSNFKTEYNRNMKNKDVQIIEKLKKYIV